MPKSRILSISNQKGGVGKTTICFNVGTHLATTGRRLLLIDADPQGNLTRSFLEDEPDGGLYEALTNGAFELIEVMRNLYLLAGSIRLATLERNLIGEIDAYTRLREVLEHPSFRDFDLILMDSPPSLGVLSTNCLTAAEAVLVPICAALYSLQGTNDLMATIAKVRKNLNPTLSILGVILNAYDSHPVIFRQIKDEISATFGDKLFRTTLSRTVKIEEAIAARSGLVAGTKAAEEIRLIAEELSERLEGMPASLCAVPDEANGAEVL